MEVTSTLDNNLATNPKDIDKENWTMVGKSMNDKGKYYGR